MIHDFFRTFCTDVSTVYTWSIHRNNQNTQQAIDAAFRIIATLGMIIGAAMCWSIVQSTLLLPARFTIKVATAVGTYAIGHDLFVMSQNNTPEANNLNANCHLGAFRNMRGYNHDNAEEFTTGTLMQPVWMMVYSGG